MGATQCEQKEVITLIKPAYLVAILLGASILLLATTVTRESPRTSATTESADDWPMLGRDARHSGYSDSVAPGNRILWSYAANEKGNVDPDVRGLALKNNVVYFAFDRFVRAIGASDKKELWIAEVGAETGGLAAIDGMVVVSAGKSLVALDSGNGKRLWAYNSGGDLTAPAISSGIVYAGSKDNSLYAVGTNGALAWKYKTYGEIHSVPAIANGRVCFGSENPDFSVYCLNSTTGEALWRHTFYRKEYFEGGMFHAPPAMIGNRVLIGEEGGKRGVRPSGVPVPPSSSKFYAFDAETGNISWEFVAPDWIVTAPAVAYGKVFFSTKWGGDVYALNVSDGSLVWKAGGNSAPIVAGGSVFVGSAGAIYSVDADTGKLLWKHETEGTADHLAIGNGVLYAGFAGGDIIRNQITGLG